MVWSREGDQLMQPSKLHDLIVTLLMAGSGLCNSVSIYRPQKALKVDHQSWCFAVTLLARMLKELPKQVVKIVAISPFFRN